MAVFVDKLRDWGWKLGPSCHLIADTNEELHAFAARLGMKRSWFQAKSCPHYDLVASRRKLAVELGAVELEDREFVVKIKAWTAAAVALVERSEDKVKARKYLWR